MDDSSVRPKRKKRVRRRAEEYYDFAAVPTEELLQMFPMPRYFQIHFSHVHDNCEHAKHQVEELRQSVERVEEKLDRLLAEMMQEQY